MKLTRYTISRRPNCNGSFEIAYVSPTLVQQLGWTNQDRLLISVKDGILIVEKSLGDGILHLYRRVRHNNYQQFKLKTIPKRIVESLGWKKGDRLFGLVYNDKLIIEKSTVNKTELCTGFRYSITKQARAKVILSKVLEFSELP